MNETPQELNQGDSERARAQFILFLKNKLAPLNGDINDATGTAYEIAGLMSTDFAQSLNSSDPIDKILTIAGELEIHPSNAEELRAELIEKIQAL